MENLDQYLLSEDIKVFGEQVHTFPEGISAAFDKLTRTLGSKGPREYYGIASCGAGYVAAAAETYPGEASSYGYDTFVVEKGLYLVKTIKDWMTKTDDIKYIFQDILTDPRADGSKPCVEIYQDMNTMMCLVKVKQSVALEEEFKQVTAQIREQVLPLTSEQFNRRRADGGWSPAQILDHLNKSNRGFIGVLNGIVEATTRQPDEKVLMIRENLEDRSTKRKAPQLVVPQEIAVNKEDVLAVFDKTREEMGKSIQTLDLSMTCMSRQVPVFGYLTRLEAITFAITHCKRHLLQLKETLGALKTVAEY